MTKQVRWLVWEPGEPIDRQLAIDGLATGQRIRVTTDGQHAFVDAAS